MRRSVVAVAIAALGLVAPGGASALSIAKNPSLYSGEGPRPGPDLLYERPAVAPQLQNAGAWRAKPILVSGATSYRNGEFLYQDFLYDDHGARQAFDPDDPRTRGNLFSKPNGTYTYPTDPRYANNAADLVELRVRALRRSTAFRVTLNTLKDPSLVAFSIAIGGERGRVFEFPRGANVRAPANLFLTVRPGPKGMVAELVRAATREAVGPPLPVKVAMKRRQVEVRVPHERWDPRRRKVRIAAGVGLWDKEAGRYLLPQAAADEDTPGGAGAAADPAAFFNVALRRREPYQKPTEGLNVVTSAAWWRDRAQGTTLAAGDISRFATKVNFGKLRRRVRDDRGVPKRGPINRIHASHFELSQGADFSVSCLQEAATCPGQYQGRLQPYALYVPKKKRRPPAGWGLTLLLHSLSATYNQYSDTRNQSQLGERGPGSLVVTTLSRGPDESYENYGAADVFEVWADIARHYRLNPAWTSISGYSMGGVGTLKLGSQFPDLFARAAPVVGFENNFDVLGSLRNVPVLMWNNHGDELVNDAFYNATANALDQRGYRYELDAFQPCADEMCSPITANHLQLAINDQYAPMARFLGTHAVDRNPHHVTYVVEPERNHANLRLVGDHAYWVGGLRLRDAGSVGEIDAVSHGFGRGDPAAGLTQVATGTLQDGNLGDLTYDKRAKTWGSAPGRSRANRIDIEATNVAKATINVERAQVNCDVKLNIKSDGPIAVTLRGCNRTVTGA
jgi:hypothetical protein